MLLALLALISATLFTGAALYISLVEHPARLGLDDAPLLAQWQPSYKAALPIQAGLAVIGGVLGTIMLRYLEAKNTQQEGDHDADRGARERDGRVEVRSAVE